MKATDNDIINPPPANNQVHDPALIPENVPDNIQVKDSENVVKNAQENVSN
jgi:hypothetical protein